MKASELRIGNLIIYMEAEIVVEGIRRNGDVDYTLNGHPYGGHNIKRYEPIPLTEEWLLKFWFKNVGIDKRKFCDVYFFNGVRLTLSNSGNMYYGKLLISSVHQLQNLYFALTNEELIYKP